MKARFENGLFGSRRNGQFAERFARIGAGEPAPDAAPAPTGPAARAAAAGGQPQQVPRQSRQSTPQQSPQPAEAGAATPPTRRQQPPAPAPRSQATAADIPAAAGSPGADPIGLVRAVARKALPPILTFSVIINMLMLTGPLFMLQVYDRALPSGNVATLIVLFFLVSILYSFFALLEGVRGRIFIRLGTRIDELLHRPVYQALLRLTGRDPAGAGPQPLRDLDAVRGYVSGTGPGAFFDMPWVPVYLGLIFFMHPLLGIFSIVAAAVLVTAAILNKRFTHQGHGEVARATFEAHRFAEEGRRDAAAAQALGMQPALVSEWTRRKGEAIGLMGRVADRAGLFASASKSLRLYFQSAMLALGAWLAIEQQITAGMIIAATIIMSRALAPIEQAIHQWQAFAGAQRAWERLQELFAKAPAEPARRTALPAPTGALQVANLACFVQGAARPVLAGIDFDLKAGAGLGVIGPSGVGKSTLVKAVLGIWPGTSGDVRLDGAEHAQWDPAVLGRHMGYLPQQATLLPGTVAQNIARFDPAAGSEAILNAARVTGAHQLAVSLPDGYDTMVGIDGVQLSSGQVQRIALARAVYGMPPILVLDEPYSNLDSDGEHALTETIRAMREFGSTVIVVTHRSSALNALDTILCLRGGRQAFYGPKDDVLRAMTRAVAGEDDEDVPRRVEARPGARQIEARAEPGPAPQPAKASVVAMRPAGQSRTAARPSEPKKPAAQRPAPVPGRPADSAAIPAVPDEPAKRDPVDQARLAEIRRRQAELQARVANAGQPEPLQQTERSAGGKAANG